jgi:hypothetical protein
VMDEAVTWYCEFMCYYKRKDVQEGKNVRSCLTHLYPKAKNNLPHTGRALSTWSKLQGKFDREPLAWDGAALVCQEVGKRNAMMGMAMWTQLRTLLREEDVAKVRWEDVVGSSTGRVALELGMLQRGESTKTGPKQGVEVLDDDLSRWFAENKARARGSDMVFPFRMEDYRAVFREGVIIVYGAEAQKEMEATLHVNRHSGAVHLLRGLKWSYPRVPGMGRWADERSVKWYANPHMQFRNQARLTPQQLSEGARIWEAPAERFGFVASAQVVGTIESGRSVASTTGSYPSLPAVPL